MHPRLTRRALLSSAGGGLLAATLPGCTRQPAASPASATPPVAAGAGGAASPVVGGESPFPADFAWGVATAAYQIEGAVTEDGRGPSVWDTFSKKPGATFEGQSGEVACDHYHRYREDITLLRELGARHYRLSVSWTRVLPAGRGAVNEKGLDFYERLVDELLRAGITPFVTLFHWDYPQALFDEGGWLARDSADWFGEYTQRVVARLGDRVQRWMTLNEPNVHVGLGHVLGLHAPGLKWGPEKSILAAHNCLRAHGRATQAIRAGARSGSAPQVGCAFAFLGRHPASDRPEDLAAAEEATFATGDVAVLSNGWWLDPMLRGHYPADGSKKYAEFLPAGFEKDLPEIQQPQDFLGLNIYWSDPARRGKDGRPEVLRHAQGYPRAANDWQLLTPQSLFYGPSFAHRRYGLPLYITENGLSVRDQLYLDGGIHDVQRIDYVQRALMRLSDAMRSGVPVRGYFYWSFLDNFEWADGYKQRFGLVYVDYETQRRIPKDSFAFYRDVIASNGARALVPSAVPADDVSP
jgi:beta-glucosidase